jgi:hypothetical protein
MHEVQVYRATIDPANVPRLLEVRRAAIAQARGGLPCAAARRTGSGG